MHKVNSQCNSGSLWIASRVSPCHQASNKRHAVNLGGLPCKHQVIREGQKRGVATHLKASDVSSQGGHERVCWMKHQAQGCGSVALAALLVDAAPTGAHGLCPLSRKGALHKGCAHSSLQAHARHPYRAACCMTRHHKLARRCDRSRKHS